MAFNKKELDNSFKSIMIDGFKFKKEIMGFSWTKEYSNRIEKIIIGYRGYPDSYVAYTPTASVYFEEVERFLLESFNKTGIVSRWGDTGTITKAFVNLQDVDYSVFNTEINNEARFMKVATEIEKIINAGALPFFEKYNTLEKIWEESEKMALEEMANFIGQPLPQRRMIIKKLCKDPQFEEYAKMVVDFYEKEKDQDVPIVKQLYHDLKAV